MNLEPLHVGAIHVGEYVSLLEHVAALRRPAVAHSGNFQAACINTS
jgi:hypothetical protein